MIPRTVLCKRSFNIVRPCSTALRISRPTICACRHFSDQRDDASSHVPNTPNSSNASDASNAPVADSEVPFWEVAVEDPKTDSHATKRTSQTEDFNLLLQELFKDVSSDDVKFRSTPGYDPAVAKKKKADNLVENQLLQMVIHHSHPWKAKPQLASQIFSPLTHRPKIYERQDDVRDSFHKQQKIGHLGMQTRDQEMRAVDRIMVCETSQELLKEVLKEMNTNDDQTYPPYYANILQKAIHQASMKFGDGYLALAIFEQAKAKSVESYVFGCTSDVYNAVLMTRWKLWKDIQGMLNVIEEMVVNGVAFNDETRHVIRMAHETVDPDHMLESDMQAEGLPWNMDEIRSLNMMKLLVSKWGIKS
ncbi:uncharacterized protein BYT42DRAFT_564733 [Radiomyces spectabilis]|uniref:uncharacterized protein n=1 Tax=Radiomyces spectabilis TaxID=64574 RepID=UPI00221EABD2|nr:uncharacterized protein BYT42DRAFT_564733 [Radiomyces spectabilis]KAI8380945.1 hypothetical protein BYT42DRAFT_564733 [Radiomyces spectabilis]